MPSFPKDNFSQQSDLYAKYRPHYSKDLYGFIFQFVKEKHRALDCGTGNGQAAAVLSEYFERVDAIDISEKQLSNAVKKPNIFYQACNAEQTPFEDNSFDLITCATAIHWFHFDRFFDEIKRVAKNKAVFACWAYDLVKTDNEEINKFIRHFYTVTVKQYWDAERGYVDTRYKTIPFPFKEIVNPGFSTVLNWNTEILEGYLNTWSAVQHYMKKNNSNPVDEIIKKIKDKTGNNSLIKATFPVFMRTGIIEKQNYDYKPAL
jgi:SAM-dependent methyltransferase